MLFVIVKKWNAELFWIAIKMPVQAYKLCTMGDTVKSMDVVKGYMQMVGMTEEDARDRVRWREMLCCGDP